MIEAAKEEILSSFPMWCADPASAACTFNVEKPHQGVAPQNPALHPGITWSNSTVALGLRGLGLENRIRSRCTGKERDTESNLDMFGARYYASSMGRFMTPDWAAKPVNVPYANFGNPQSLNLYSYVENNPTTAGDPDGHCIPFCFALAGGGALLANESPLVALGPIGWAVIGGTAIVVGGYAYVHYSHPDNSGQNAPPPPTKPTNVSQGTPGTTTTNVATGTPASTSQQGAVDSSPIQQAGPNYVGNNVVQGSGRVNSDLPGGQAEAGQKFGELTAGQGTRVEPKTGHTVADDGTRLRNNADGTARIDRPASVTGGQHETVHFNQPKKPDQPNQ